MRHFQSLGCFVPLLLLSFTWWSQSSWSRSVMSRVLSSSRSGKKSDWLSGRLLPILKMEFIQEMLSSERKQVLEWEDSLTSSPSFSSVASGSYFLFDMLQLNCKTNDPETYFKYVRAFIHFSRKDLSAYLKHTFEVFLNFKGTTIPSLRTKFLWIQFA